MGFWEEERQGEKILIGDEPLDILTDAFQQIANHYQTDVGRKPTILELEKLIQLALEYQDGCLSEMENFTYILSGLWRSSYFENIYITGRDA